MNKKYQIFVSSTYEDLKDEREQVLKAILRLGHIPIGMEMFNAGDETQWEMIKRRIEESDYYLVIIAQRYGSMKAQTGHSYTEQEYDYAVSLKIPTLGFVLRHEASWPGNLRESDQGKQEKLAEFIKKVDGRMRSSWSNKDELATNVALALSETLAAHPGVGWVRGNEATGPVVLEEMARLSSENSTLRAALAEKSSGIVGMPKISLTCAITNDSKRFGFEHRGSAPPAWSDDGVWLDIVVANTGTGLADVKLVLHVPASLGDGVAFTALRRFLQTQSTGAPNTNLSSFGVGIWLSVEMSGEDEAMVLGTVRLLAGEKTTLILPVAKRIPRAMLARELRLSAFPSSGHHVEQSYSIQFLAEKAGLLEAGWCSD